MTTAAQRVLDELEALGDEAAVHIFPSDLRRCMTSECSVAVASVRVGNADERSVPLFSLAQIEAALFKAGGEQGQLRAEQASAVMPQIGPLLDAWDGMANDTKGVIREEAPDLARWLGSISRSMESES